MTATTPGSLTGAEDRNRIGGETVGRLEQRRRRAALLFLLPTVVALLLVAGWPLLRTVYLGFTDARLGSTEEAAFIGFANFGYLLTDPGWWQATWVTLKFASASVVLETLLGMVIALVLNAHLPGRGLMRAAVLVPWAIPTVISAQMWGWMYHDLYGVVNTLLVGIGILDAPVAWMADPDTALWAMVAVDVWKTTPFMALLILAALQTLPTEIYEAARVDGVHPVRVFFRVTLPLIRPALMVAIIFRALDALRMFDLAYVLAGGNPATATLSVYARQNLVDFQDVGYGSAASTLLVLLILLITIILLTVGRVRLAADTR
ncbi:carbohydrate ABC transporter permease [Rhodospirillum centenum]|uniref:Maltose transport system permease protein malF, putative n=1 Tax=Rhodospirillum centenum (strain ATCC 51521 / SW) TaxID=414684 RepID=B6IXP9_RHOCS|nr:sugar ABC transporter permease [Rhodospirillum centenum]ACJ01073.1 maltose transport system permease protein malF, putative [Rhodospirillum centenum SW]